MTRRLANNRGVILLLAVYFSALLLLLLGGVSLQRTNVEVRASQLSRDVQQGVFLAEAGLDRILAVFRNDPLVSDEVASRTFTLANGTIQAQVTTPADAIQTDGSEIRRVTLTGTTSNGIAQRIYAVLKLTGDGAMPFREGFLGNGEVFVGTSGHNGGILTINGPIGSRAGSVGSVILFNTKVKGSVLIGPPSFRAHNTQKFIGPTAVFTDWSARYNDVYRPGLAGFGWLGSGVQTINSEFTGSPLVTDLPVPARPDLDAYDQLIKEEHTYVFHYDDGTTQTSTEYAPKPGACDRTYGPVHEGHLGLRTGEPFSVEDGGPLDVDGEVNGKIFACFQSMTLSERSQLTFTAPATVYLVYNERPWSTDGPWALSGLRPWHDGAYIQQTNTTIQALRDGNPLPNGVELVVPEWSELSEATLVGITGSFYGSIWAPRSSVLLFDESKIGIYLAAQTHEGRLITPPVRVFSQVVWLYSDRPEGAPTLTFKATSNDGSPAPRHLEVSLVHWSLESPLVEGESLDKADPNNLAVIDGAGKMALRVTHHEEGAPINQWEYDPVHMLD